MTNITTSTVIVTGGSRGYGAGIAEAFVKAGARVWITGRNQAKLQETANRIGASRLFDLARALEVPVEYFYDEMPPDVMAASPRHMAHATEEPAPQRIDPMSKRETLDLVRTYYKIGDPNVRKRVYELARALAVHTGGRTEKP